MLRSVAAYVMARKKSQRCPNKMLRPFANTTLYDIALAKLKRLKVDEKYVCAYDDEFFARDIDSSIKTYRRSYESATIDKPLRKVFEAYDTFTSDYVMFINASHAHVKVDTLQKAIDFFKSTNCSSLTSVNRIADWIFDLNGEFLFPTVGTDGDTKVTQQLFRVSHAFHIYDRQRFLETECFFGFKPSDPYLFEINKQEALDVDDEEDFMISEAVYLSQKKE